MELSSSWRRDVDPSKALFVGRNAHTLPEALAKWGPNRPFILIKRDLGSAADIRQNAAVRRGGQSADRPLILGLDEPDQPPPIFDRGIDSYSRHLAAREDTWGLIDLHEPFVAVTGLNLTKVGNGIRLIEHHYHLSDISVERSWADFISCFQPRFRGATTIRRIVVDGMNTWKNSEGKLHTSHGAYVNGTQSRLGDVVVEDFCVRNVTGAAVHNKGTMFVKGKRIVGVNTRTFMTAYLGGAGEYEDCAWLRDDIPRIPNPDFLLSPEGEMLFVLGKIKGVVRIRNSEFHIVHPSARVVLHHGDEALYENNDWWIHDNAMGTADGRPDDVASDSPTSGTAAEDRFWESNDIRAFFSRDRIRKANGISAEDRAAFMKRRWAPWSNQPTPTPTDQPTPSQPPVRSQIDNPVAHELRQIRKLLEQSMTLSGRLDGNKLEGTLRRAKDEND